MTERILSLAKIALAIIGTVATVFSCLIAFIVLANPTAAQRIIIEFYNPTTPTPQVVVITQPAPTLPPLPTYTPLPTNMPVITNTSIPIATATFFVPPADGILFQDNFDNGFKTDWNLGNDWITADGTLSQIAKGTSNSYGWATLNKSEWKNYILSVKINIPYMSSAAQSDVAVAVRVNGQTKYLGVQILPFVGNALFFIGNSKFDSDAVASSRVFDFESGSTLEIEANGNNFVVRVNGRQVQQVSISGYDSGGIALGINCGSSLGCPSFDNVKVTYLP